MLFVGVDWAEDHHDVCVMAEDGEVLGKRRVPDSVVGIGDLHGLVAEHAGEDEPVVVGVEVDRGLLVWSLLTAGYEVYAVNPLAAARYRDRHATSGAKSDPGDARMLADLVRTDRHNHRPIAGDSDLAEGVKLLARAHQNAIWSRQRQLNALRSALREYYPGALAAFGTNPVQPGRTGHLGHCPDSRARPGALTIEDRRRPAKRRSPAQHRPTGRRDPTCPAGRQLGAAALIAGAHGVITRSAVALITSFNAQIAELEAALSEHFEQRPDAKVVLSLPGRSSALGCWASSVMTALVSRPPSLARITPARHR